MLRSINPTYLQITNSY